jgi:putative transposase
MPRRNLVFADNEIYHVYNRSIGGVDLFNGQRLLRRVLNLLDYYRFPQTIRYSKYKSLPIDVRSGYFNKVKNEGNMVEIYAFSFMPSHYHLLIKQVKGEGIRRLVSNFQNGFAKYFNTRNDRSGGLFQSPFKAKRIESDEIFSHVSRYIHLNPVTSFLIKMEQLAKYPNTSYKYYLGSSGDGLVNTEFILKIFGRKEAYAKFVEDQVDYQKRLHLIKKHTFK